MHSSNERFRNTYSGYKKALSIDQITLSDYCKIHHVDYRGMRRWMSKNSITVKELKKAVSSLEKSGSGLIDPSHGLDRELYPLSFESTCSRNKAVVSKSGSLLKGVSITFPDGVIVSIREISRKDLTEFIVSYN